MRRRYDRHYITTLFSRVEILRDLSLRVFVVGGATIFADIFVICCFILLIMI